MIENCSVHDIIFYEKGTNPDLEACGDSMLFVPLKEGLYFGAL